MKQGEIRAVIVGADRIAANGDTANKIGTYTVAVLAHENGIPFYVAAPLSTIDMEHADGSQIPIEERRGDRGDWSSTGAACPPGARVRHPAFDVTPAAKISAIITEAGVLRPPYGQSIAAALAIATQTRFSAAGSGGPAAAGPDTAAGSADDPVATAQTGSHAASAATAGPSGGGGS